MSLSFDHNSPRFASNAMMVRAPLFLIFALIRRPQYRKGTTGVPRLLNLKSLVVQHILHQLPVENRMGGGRVRSCRPALFRNATMIPISLTPLPN